MTARLPGTAIETTALGFGCAGLFDGTTRQERARLLEAAYDVGICHFDVAPMYGLGLVEQELGRFLRGRRDRVVVATKFGIEPTAAGRVAARVQAPLRRGLGAAPALRERIRPNAGDARAGAAGAALYRSRGYDARAARRSLEKSLRALRTDYVDLLFLHDPRPGDVHSDDVRAYLESAVSAGSVRAWGVAGEPDAVLEAVKILGSPLPVVQVRDDLFGRQDRRVAVERSRAAIFFAPVARALPRILHHVGASAEARRRWTQVLGTDAASAETMASLLILDAVDAADGAPVVFGSRRPERIAAAAAALASRDRPNPVLGRFRALVAAEITAGGVET